MMILYETNRCRTLYTLLVFLDSSLSDIKGAFSWKGLREESKQFQHLPKWGVFLSFEIWKCPLKPVMKRDSLTNCGWCLWSWDAPPLFGSVGGPETKTACSRSVPCWWRAPRRQTEDVFCVNSDVTSWKKKTHQRSENSRLLKSEFFKNIIQNQISSNFFLPSCLLFQLNVVCVVHRSRVFFLEPPTFLQVGRWSIWSGATCPCLMEHQSLPTLQEVASTLLVTSGKAGTEVTIYFAANKKEIPKKGVFLVRYLSIEYKYTYYLNIYIYISY